MTREKAYDVTIIGAGAAGLIASGRAAELGAKVLLIEKMSQPGRKLLITGKGRCNITNHDELPEFLKHIYPDSRFLRPAFNSFFSDDIIDLLNRSGVKTTVERGGRVFPLSNRASDVVNALIEWNRSNGVSLSENTRVNDLIIENNTVRGVIAEKQGVAESIYTSRVIICTGGKSYPATGSTGDGYRMAKLAGHHIKTPRPALVPLQTAGPTAGKLQGISLKNVKALLLINEKKIREEFGEMIFTHFGLSGPIILSMSRFVSEELQAGNKVEISIDLKPALNEEKLDKRLLRDLNMFGKRQLNNLFRLWLPAGMVSVFIEELSLDPAKEAHQITGKERRKILNLLKEMRFNITGVRPFRESIITAGGVPTGEIYPKTMESLKVKNLFFAGEVIDLDADTGGYNLQIAWSTGWLAGTSVCQ